MFFKDKRTLVVCMLMHYDVEEGKVVLGFQDCTLTLGLADFHINYEYVWMSHK